MYRSRLVFALLLGPAVLSCTPAESPRAEGQASVSTAMIPKELAEALLSAYGGPDDVVPQMIAGRVPEGFPSDLLPTQGARLLGGWTRPHRRTAVVAVPESPPDALAAQAERAARAGWEHRREPSTPAGGFIEAAEARPLMHCRGKQSLYAQAVAHPQGGSYLLVALSRQDRDRYSFCRPAEKRGIEAAREAPMPVLRAPAGAEDFDGGGGGGWDSSHMYTRFRTPLPPAELVAHFAPQLCPGPPSARWCSASCALRAGDVPIL